MGYNREQVNGNTPQDLNKMNENFMNLWSKVFGDIDFSDTNNKLKERICTQWIPVQGEGNLDSKYPLNIRFFVPPNTKKIKSSNFSFIAENYRMDSDIALGGGGVVDAPISLSVSPGSTLLKVNEQAISSTVANWRTCNGSHGVDLPTSHVGLDAGDFNLYVSGSSTDAQFLEEIRSSRVFYNTSGPYYYSTYYNGTRFVPVLKGKKYSNDTYELHGNFVDLGVLDHVHDITHSHQIYDPGHTHDGFASINLDPHHHDLNAGIKVDTRVPDNVIVTVNDVDIAIIGSSTGLIKNDVDLSKHLKIGQWNTIKVSAGMVARVVVYGTIEVVTNYF